MEKKKDIKKKVAIIGGGASGLVSCKELLEVSNNCIFEPVIFEKENKLGGTWSESNTKAWNSLTTNVSKYSQEFSDFQFDCDQLFPNQIQVFQYLNNYSKHFNLLKYLKTNCNVIKVCKTLLNTWIVEWIEYIDNKQSIINKMEFDFIIIACGVFNKPASINNIKELNGLNYYNSEKIIHSKDYKSPQQYINKKVLIIGNGSSGNQICYEISKNATLDNPVYHLTKTIKWIVPVNVVNNIDNESKPIDAILFKRSLSYKLKEMDEIEKNKMMYSLMKQLSNNNEDCKDLKVDKPPELASNYIITNIDYLNQVKNGKIKIIRSIDDSGDICDGGDRVTIDQFDKVIICNGYNLDLSFLDDNIKNLISFDENEIYHPLKNLYKNVFCPDLCYIDKSIDGNDGDNISTSIAFIGMYNYPVYPITELMARWVSLIFSNQLKLREISLMKEWIQLNNQKIKNKSKNNNKTQTPYGDRILFCDDLANEIGCLPNLNEIKLQSPHLYNALYNSMFHCCCYRLNGSNSRKEQSINTLLNVLNNKTLN